MKRRSHARDFVERRAEAALERWEDEHDVELTLKEWAGVIRVLADGFEFLLQSQAGSQQS